MKLLFLFLCFAVFGISVCDDQLQNVTLKFMTYNIRLKDDNSGTWARRKAQIASLIKHQNPDVIALQGITRNNSRIVDKSNQTIDQMKDLEKEIFNQTNIQYSGNVIFSRKRDEDVDRGVAILMRWERIEPGTYTKLSVDTPLLYVNGTDRPAGSSEPLANYHQLRLFTSEFSRNKNDRKTAMENALLAMEKKTNWSWIPTVFLGDFGVVDSDESTVASLTQPSSASNRYLGDFLDVFKVYQKLINHTAHTNPINTTFGNSRPDRIYIRGNISVVSYEVLPMSRGVADHNPVLATLNLYTPPPKDDDEETPPLNPDEGNSTNTNANTTISVPTSPSKTDEPTTTTTPTTPNPTLDPGTMDVSKSVIILTLVFGVIVVVAVGVAIYYFRTRKMNRRGKEYFKPLEFDRFTLSEISATTKDRDMN